MCTATPDNAKPIPAIGCKDMSHHLSINRTAAARGAVSAVESTITAAGILAIVNIAAETATWRWTGPRAASWAPRSLSTSRSKS
jgi:hypothetical protein